MTHQLRVYRVKPGAMDAWVREWTEKIRPLREQAGFTVLGPWVIPVEDTFVWILGHEDFEAADDAYYASAERAAVEPDPTRHLLETEQRLMHPV